MGQACDTQLEAERTSEYQVTPLQSSDFHKYRRVVTFDSADEVLEAARPGFFRWGVRRAPSKSRLLQTSPRVPSNSMAPSTYHPGQDSGNQMVLDYDLGFDSLEDMMKDLMCGSRVRSKE